MQHLSTTGRNALASRLIQTVANASTVPANWRIPCHAMATRKMGCSGSAIQSGKPLASSPCLSSPSTIVRAFDRLIETRRKPHLLRKHARGLSGSAANVDVILESWAAEIPHPQKRDKGGEDAHFILTRSLADGSSSIGVADGVGGWAEVGVDPGIYSRELMAQAKMRLESDLSPPCPVDALSVAYRMVREQGSSTACLAVLHNRKLETLNLGDSGFILLRPSLRGEHVQYECIAESKEQTHGFNFPYQLGTSSNDAPHHGDNRTFDVQPDDVIVMATDGLWDNVYQKEIIELVQECHDGHELEKAAARIASKATKLGMAQQIQSPFAERAWLEHKLEYPGGKLDDVTVLVARVAKAPARSDTPLL